MVGTLRPSFMGRTLAGASFEYDRAFIESGYPLSPGLPLRSGRTYTAASTTMFGVFQDAAPDEWGRRIVQTAHTREARKAGAPARVLGEFDFLLGVADATRMGALRLRELGGNEWLSSDERVANVHELPRILEAARRYEKHEATDEDIAYLNGIATSPGGARPKANVVSQSGTLALAKLPHSNDGDIDVERWEAVALTLARQAGIPIAPFILAAGEARTAVLVVQRFDRGQGDTRIPYMSAFTAMGLGTHKTGSQLTYVDLADTVADLTADPKRELHDLFRRVAFTVLIGNADDHWRNHGFLHHKRGWALSPAFDLNPSRVTSPNSRSISENADPDQRNIHDLLEVADAFQLTTSRAASAAADVARVVRGWPDVARSLNVPEREVEVMADAFREDQVEAALTLGDAHRSP